jgi:hypothetical protein
LHYEIHKLIMLIGNKEELPHQWIESIVVPIHKKVDKTDCSNYRGISLLSTSYKILSNILLFDRLCGLVVSVEDYKHRGPRFDSRALLRILLRELGLERGPLSLVIR